MRRGSLSGVADVKYTPDKLDVALIITVRSSDSRQLRREHVTPQSYC
jgi:hypothetical protein